MRVFILLDGYQSDTSETAIIPIEEFNEKTLKAILAEAGGGRLFNGKIFFGDGGLADMTILGPNAAMVAAGISGRLGR